MTEEWKFPTRGYGETEGFANAGLEDFRGQKMQALARETCQNSLDAADGSGKPVRMEFHDTRMKISEFPGMTQLQKVLQSCWKFWKNDGDVNTRHFLQKALKSFEQEKFTVLRISDFQTKGVQGAFSGKNITPWGSLVKGNSFSVKSDEKNAAGSYGIGKSAPFVSSRYQTVFYRTYDIDGEKAVLGVSRLMAHRSINPVPEGEDPVRRSVGYFGENENRQPLHELAALDAIYPRTEHGTDLFIPGFLAGTDWETEMLVEIVDNFLYAIDSGKLEVSVGNQTLTKETLSAVLSRLGNKAKHANLFYQAIHSPEAIPLERDFHGLGKLNLRLFYGPDLNRKILVVRNSGMKIASIPALPRGISYVGFLELKGERLNEFFRGMENPKHTEWQPGRHTDPKLAKKYKEEVESWVRETINQKMLESSGEESTIDVGNCFNDVNAYLESKKNESKAEGIVDTAKSIDVIPEVNKSDKNSKLRDIGGEKGTSSGQSRKGKIDDEGPLKGHRSRTGQRKGGSPTGRSGHEDPDGPDRVYPGTHLVNITARIISRGNGMNRLIYTAEKPIEMGEIRIVTKGENGKEMQLRVLEASGAHAKVVNGYIVVSQVPAGEKQIIDFRILGKQTYAMGVNAHGN